MKGLFLTHVVAGLALLEQPYLGCVQNELRQQYQDQHRAEHRQRAALALG
jgi:hypothetical protein